MTLTNRRLLCQLWVSDAECLNSNYKSRVRNVVMVVM